MTLVVDGRYDYVKYSDKSQELQAKFKSDFQQITNGVEMALRPSRAQALALTKLEEAYMWIGKAIRDEQVSSLPSVETCLNESRDPAV